MGAGGTKNRRGAGSRGGRGNAGHRKHKIATFMPLKEKNTDLKQELKEKKLH